MNGAAAGKLGDLSAKFRIGRAARTLVRHRPKTVRRESDMWDFSLGGALGMMARTLPFILLRMAVYFGITLGYILVTGAGAGIGYGVGGFGDADFQASTTMWGGFAGFGIFGAIMYWVN